MKPHLAFWVLPLFACVLSAAPITCIAGAASIPVFNPSSVSGAVGDYTLDCTGGTSGSPTLMNFTSFMNLPVLNTGGWILTDGVNNFPGTLGFSNVVNFLNVPFNPPGAGHLDFQVENILVNPSLLPPGADFNEIVTITGALSINVVNAEQVVAVNASELPTLPVTALLLGAFVAFARKPAWR